VLVKLPVESLIAAVLLAVLLVLPPPTHPRVGPWVLSEYHNMIKNDPAAEDFEAPPRPMALIRGRNVDSRQFMDRSRVIHLRLEQQSALIQ
jgi:hypothetical protein